MSHFTDLELHRWRDSGAGAERPRVVEHLAACADCASRYADAIRSRPLQAEPAEDVADFVAAGLRVPRRRRIPVLPALAAAAAVFIVLLALPLIVLRRPAPAPDLHFRGSGIHALVPMGAVDRNAVEFVWASGIAASRYVVQIGQGDRVVFTASTASTRLSVPPGLLKPGADYWWTVTAFAPDGHAVASSPRRHFLVRQYATAAMMPRAATAAGATGEGRSRWIRTRVLPLAMNDAQ